jgi:hypothetical protein
MPSVVESLPRACTIKHYGFVIYGFCSRLECLSKLVCLSKPVKVTDYRRDTILLRNLSIFRKLRVRKFL